MVNLNPHGVINRYQTGLKPGIYCNIIATDHKCDGMNRMEVDEKGFADVLTHGEMAVAFVDTQQTMIG